MSSLTGLATGQISDIFKTMIFNGQMKIASASSGVRESNGSQSLSSITIPALTGNQIAIVFLELSTRSRVGNATGTMTASGTGFSVGVGVAVHDGSAANVAIPVGNTQINSSFAMTTSGSQTITPSMTFSLDNSANLTGQACVFIYSPPF
jgi:hypothetical protein